MMKYFRLLSTLAISTALVGCLKKAPDLNDNVVNALTGSGIDVPEPPGFSGDLSTIPAGQVLSSMESVLGVSASAQTRSLFGVQQSNFDASGNAENLSPPAMLGLVGVASEMCRDLRVHECTLAANQRLYYSSFGCSGNQDFSDPVRTGLINTLYIGILGRVPTGDEMDIVKSEINNAGFPGNNYGPNAIDEALRVSCTMVLASADFLIN